VGRMPGWKPGGKSTGMRIFRPIMESSLLARFSDKRCPPRNLNWLSFWAGYKFRLLDESDYGSSGPLSNANRRGLRDVPMGAQTEALSEYETDRRGQEQRWAHHLALLHVRSPCPDGVGRRAGHNSQYVGPAESGCREEATRSP
jgi:hypothetical protein